MTSVIDKLSILADAAKYDASRPGVAAAPDRSPPQLDLFG